VRDARDRADRIDLLHARLVYGRVVLGREEDRFVAPQGGF
jgi:hypothetical protein